MDQLKTAWAWFRKHHFWVFCVAIFGASVGVWYMGTDQMEQETKSRVSQLESIQRQQQEIRGRFQPNDQVISEMKKQNVDVSRDIWYAWRTMYDEQMKSLEWPRGMGGIADELNQRFAGRRAGTKMLFDQRHLEAYRDEFKKPNEVNRLKAILQLREVKEPEEGSTGAVGELSRGGRVGEEGPGPGVRRGRGGDEQVALETTGLIEFSSAGAGNAEFYNLFRFGFTDRNQPPSPGEVMITQENLWIYESLFKALAKVNAGVKKDNAEEARVKSISLLKIGAEALPATDSRNASAGLMAHLQSLAGAAAARGAGPSVAGGPFGEGAFGEGGYGPGVEGTDPFGRDGSMSEGPMGGPPGVPPGTMGPGGMGPGGMGPGTAGPGGATAGAFYEQEIGRYCKADGTPVQVTEIEAAKKDPYKLVPLHMMLVVDQRHLPALLGSLANAHMPVRIRQVQMYRASMAPQMGEGTSRRLEETVAEKPTFDVGVEIRGMIHIYNPPNPDEVPHFVEDYRRRQEELRNQLPPGGSAAPAGTPTSMPARSSVPATGS